MGTRKINIKVNKDFRCFLAGDEFEFEFSMFKPLWLVGNNGTGKSTLVEAIRCMRNDANTRESIALYKHNFKDVFTIDGLDQYDKILHLSATVDDSLNFCNASSATDFIDFGGFWLSKMSHGQRAMAQLNSFVGKTLEENLKDVDPFKTLIILDEADKGLDLRYQVGYANMVKNLAYKYMCDVLVISHNPVCWLISGYVYSIEDKELMTSTEYIKSETGISLTVDDLDKYVFNKKDKK